MIIKKYDIVNIFRSLIIILMLSGVVSLLKTRELFAQEYDAVYTVTVESKTEEHPFYEMGFGEGYAIDGVEGAELMLTKGENYAFVMDNVSAIHPFYISTDEVGNGAGLYSSGVMNNGVTGNDTLFFTPPLDAPDSLYYQCQNHDYMGYKIHLQEGVTTTMNFSARLSGSSEIPPVATGASGMITAQLENDSLFVSGSFSELGSEINIELGGGAHIHIAPAGLNGGVAIPLNITADPDMRGGTFLEAENSFGLTSQQKTALMDRKMYVNIHTMNDPAGEIRGQLLVDADHHFEAVLTAGSQVHQVRSNAIGGLVGELHGDSLLISGSFQSLESEFNTDIAGGSHIHSALAGSQGGVEISLNVVLTETNTAGSYQISQNRFELTPEQKAALMERKLYVNVHSMDYPAGEIRGQLVPISDAYLEGVFSGAAQTPSVYSTGKGAVLGEVRGDSLFLSGSFRDLSSDFDADVAGGSHLHMALAGSNGGVEISLNATTNGGLRSGTYAVIDNSFEMTVEQKTALMNRKLYANIHTANHQAGEIRAQMLPISNLYFQTSLSGMNEVDPVHTAGVGGMVIELKGNEIVLSGSFSELSSDFASQIAGGSHLHEAAIHGNGGVVFPLSAETSEDLRSGQYQAGENTFSTSMDTVDMLRDEMLYGKIHTESFLAGEIRGQMLHSPNMPPDSTAIQNPGEGATVEIEGIISDSLMIQWTESGDTNQNEIAYIYQLSSEENFSSENLILNVNTGLETDFMLSYGAIDTLLSNMNILLNDSVDLYHRIIATDGSDRTAGEISTATFVRGPVSDIVGKSNLLPDKFVLYNNYPNPFNPFTTIKYAVPERSTVKITIFDLTGKEVITLVEDIHKPGQYSLRWDARDKFGESVSAGVYFYRLQSENFESIKKMVMLK